MTISVKTLKGIIKIRLFVISGKVLLGINKITIDKEKANNFRFYGKDIRPFTENYGNTLYHPREIVPLQAKTVPLKTMHPF